MKKVLGTIVASMVVATTTMAHDLKYTLTQDGSTQVATCTGKALGTVEVSIFKKKNSKESYVVLTNSDEDSGAQYEFIAQTATSTQGHDVEAFSNSEFSLQVASVGEGALPAKLQLAKPSALKVWLKTYGQGAELKSVSLECVAQ